VLESGVTEERALERASELDLASVVTPVGSLGDPRAVKLRDVTTRAERVLSVAELEQIARADAEGRDS
jgi:hypothetical protein